MAQLHLFQAFGIELEYMIVDCDTLQIRPITDELLKHELGTYGGDYENGMVTWSNELVLHVVELKSTKPELDFVALEKAFAENVTNINKILSKWNAMLMPTAAHPFMNPMTETKLWPHDNNEVYNIYNKIFDCRGHGWSNLQSTHLNLPFCGDEEFAKLHAAIRIILALLPALCASSPILDGKLTGTHDTRLLYYKTNQKKIPSLTGSVIPEPVFSQGSYSDVIYSKISNDIASYNTDDILDPVWVNSRGAIPRFDRGSIEIRIMDIQECPAADLAIATLVIETIKALVAGRFISTEYQMKWSTENLVDIFNQIIERGQLAVIDNPEYLSLFGCEEAACSPATVWQVIIERLIENGNPSLEHCRPVLTIILKEGTLAQRIEKAIGISSAHQKIIDVYKRLSDCLAQNKMFY